MQHGRIPIMIVAALGDRELVEILFPRTKPIASLPNWSVDGIIDTMKYLPLKAQAREKYPHDATLFANRSLCWLRLGDADHALFDAQHCKRMRPLWSKAWYREGAAWEATDALRNAKRPEIQNP
ncbi:hypothetical protein HU200_014988 [Digitaria exilis]|uniref:Uncharacterized protein n=1 Tax=Digitaria exilis TaxID=1010633 RepID=A0A835FBU4_9POAL|nr:hypothetical protein HU200_014988 [Digitaria exilis]